MERSEIESLLARLRQDIDHIEKTVKNPAVLRVAAFARFLPSEPQSRGTASACGPRRSVCMIGALLLDLARGCLHARTTFPMTPVRRGGFREQATVTCLGCGRVFAYDWATMRRGAEIEQRVLVLPALVAEAEL